MLQRRLAPQDRREAVQKRRGDDKRAGAAVAQHEIVVGGGEQRVDRHRHDAGLDGTQEHGREIDGIEQAKQHPLLRLDTKAAKGAGGAIDPLAQRRIGVAAAIVVKRRLAAAPSLEVPLDQVDGGVVVARKDDLRRHARRAVGGH
ncbi:MAG TPA: hypothetical protein VGU20_16430 [Stellaceae bacterium]|nr:hypothetical protein [Stellaceae bacterium]